MKEMHRLLLAGAGAGKTTYLVQRLLESDEFSLITTFTIRNAEEIRKKIREINGGAIPRNIEVMTWDAFLIRHGIKPFLASFTKKRITGLHWVNGQADGAPRWAKADTPEYYMTSLGLLYSDKLAKLTCVCDDKTNGLVISRLSRCYKHIYIDEAQDLAGYDFEFVKKLLNQDNANIILTCDPRQATYNTHSDKKNKKYNDGHIDLYIQDNCASEDCVVDTTTLNRSYRCCRGICAFSSKLYEDEYPEVISKASYEETGHDGVFLIRQCDVDTYLKQFPGMIQLRESRRTNVNENSPVLNMGESKGMTFERVLIYPTGDMLKWINNRSTQLAPRTKSKFYVALTRAKYSVAIVCKDDKLYKRDLEGVQKWYQEL